MTSKQALEFVAQHGVVLEAARGPVPNLAEAVADGPIQGSWWGHPQSHAIHRITKAVRGSPEVLVCRLIAGKVTFVHRRLWPAIVAIARRIPQERLVHIREVHTPKGHHQVLETAFPDWVPSEVAAEARALSESTAETALGPLAEAILDK